MGFKVGDKVVATIDWFGIEKGAKGIVVDLHRQEPYVGIEFDKILKNGCGHNCDGHAKIGHGYYLKDSYLKLAKSDIKFKIVKKCK